MFEAQGHVVRPDAADHQASDVTGQHLEVYVPQPGDVPAIRGEIVDRNQHHAGRRPCGPHHGAQHLIKAGRILGQQQDGLAPICADPFGAAKRGRKCFYPARHRLQGHAQLQTARRGRQDVVNVIDAGQDGPHLRRARRRSQCKSAALEPREFNMLGGNQRLRTVCAALRTPVVAHVPKVHHRVFVRDTAAITVARIRGVLQRAGAAGRVGNPKRHRRPGKFCSDIRDEWIISVEDHDRLAGRSAIEDRAPAPGNDINLAIPVQLVTEKVGQHDGAGL